MNIRDYIIFLLIIHCVVVYSRERELHFKQLTVNDGLQSNFISNITQDSDGFMWFASDNVLSRYDGYSFLVIENLLSDSNSISTGVITDMVEDNQHNLWIATSNGLNCFNLKTYNYKGIFRSHEEMRSSILSLYFDQKHTLWVGCDTEGIFVYDIKSGKIDKKYTHNPQDTNSLIHNSIRTIYRENEQNFWIGTKAGLDKLDMATGTFSHYLKGFMIRTILIDSKGQLWVGDENNGLWYAPNTSNPEFSLVTDIPDISEDIPTEMIEDKSGNLWFGVRDHGIFYLKSGQDEWRNLLPDKYNPNSIKSIVPQAIYEDIDGRVWVGTFDAGINFLDNHEKAFLHVEENLRPDRLINDKIRAVYQDSEDDIWLGSRVNGMLSKFNREDFTFKHYKHNPENPYSISDENVLCIREDRPGYLWIGTYHGGLNLFEKETGKFTTFKHDPGDPNSIAQNSIYSLLKADDGKLYVGTMYKGLDIYDPEKKTFKNYRAGSDPRSLSYDHVRGYLYQDSQKNIWVGTLGGLNLYHPATDDFTRFMNDPQDLTSISNNRIYCIYEDKQGNLWICTNGGLNLMDRKNNTFTAYTTEDGLLANAVFGALEDDHGNLWLSTSAGISKFNPGTKTFKNYMAGNDFKTNEVHIYGKLHSNGEMIFGGNDGFTLFHPDNIDDNSVIPAVVITGFKIFNQPVEVGGEESVLKNHISHTRDITLNHDQSVFTFDFVALNYTSPEKNQYAYMMEGFEKKWNYVGTQRNATYTNLDPGEYTFRVKASNNDGVWNEEGTSINITILPPWWETLWFRIFALLFIIFGAISFYLIRINRIEKQKKLLAIEVENRTKELKLANEQLNEQKKSIEKSFNNIKTLSEFGHRLTASLSVSEIDRMIYKYMNNLIESDIIGLGIYIEKNQCLDFKLLMENKVPIDSFSSALTDKSSCAAWCFNHQKIVFSNHFQKEYHKYTEKLNIRTSQTPESVIYYPLTTLKKKLGVITLQSYKENAYTDYEKAIVKTLASYISVALDNANAYQEIAEKNEALVVQSQDLNEVNVLLEEKQQRIEEQAEEISTNVEELNEKNAKLNELVATKDKFFSIIAHDLKSPFNIILGMGNLLITRYQKYDDSKRIDLINNINISAKKIYALLENLLHWARSQMGTIDFEPGNINTYDTVRSVFNLVSDQATEKGLELKNELVNPTYVFADHNMINTVIRNLVTNALKFTKEGFVAIGSEDNGKEITISVKDTGTGIDEESLNKLFKLVSSRSRQGTSGEMGTGLGLILCREFIEKNNGRIWVESEIEKGTTFFISLPKPNSEQ